MVVIEFRDAAGRLAASLPTSREIEAYKASVLFGADLPSDVPAMKMAGDGPSAARPGIPAVPKEEAPRLASVSVMLGKSIGFDKVA